MYVINYKGKDIKLTEYCRIRGIDYHCLMSYMYRHGLDVEEAVEKYEKRKDKKSVKEICKEKGISYIAVTQYKFYHSNKSYEEIIEMYEKRPKRNHNIEGKTLKEYCREKGIEKEYMRICMYKYKHGCSIEEAIEKVIGVEVNA